jgi:uncharacterized protein (TIGR02246 family)
MDDPYDMIRRWEHAFNQGDGRDVAALYAPDAILWGTLAPTLIASPQAIHAYFVDAAAAGLTVRLGEHASTLLSETCAVDAGHYEFSRTKDGAVSLLPARYSIVLARTGGSWVIAHHHSSILPVAPA